MSEYLLPPLNNQTTIKKVYAIENSHAAINFENINDADSDVYQNHILKVQEVILDSTDSKINSVKDKLKESELRLRQSQQDQVDSGVNLYRAQKNISTLNKTLQST
jgi:hypothetical protein